MRKNFPNISKLSLRNSTRMRIPVLTSDLTFPEPKPSGNGLVAIGGDLEIPRLLLAYRTGVFPWYNPGEPICWWSPDPRCIFIPGEVRVSKSLRQKLRKSHLHVTVDSCFEEVIRHCASAGNRAEGTWISEEMREAYIRLHHEGYAHSFEVWDSQAELVGGLYGVSIGRAFFGESMFSLVPDASKLALLALEKFSLDNEFLFIDGQLENDYLLQMGARLLSRKLFLETLATSNRYSVPQGKWNFSYRFPLEMDL